MPPWSISWSSAKLSTFFSDIARNLKFGTHFIVALESKRHDLALVCGAFQTNTMYSCGVDLPIQESRALVLQSRFVQVLSLASARRTTRPPSGTLTQQEIGAETLKPDQGCAGPSISSMSSPLRLHKEYKKGLSYPSMPVQFEINLPSPTIFALGCLSKCISNTSLDCCPSLWLLNVIAPGFYVVNFHEDGNTTTERVGVDAAPQTVNLSEKRGLTFTSSSTKYA